MTAAASSAPVTIDPALRDVVSIAADATWLYLAGSTGTGDTFREGVYRIRRTDLGTAPAEWIANVNISSTRAPVVIDSTTAASHLYVRAGDGSVHVVVDPGGAPVHLGVISTLGRSADSAMAYAPATDSLYVFETLTSAAGNFVRLD
jgi:hypothetical protein